MYYQWLFFFFPLLSVFLLFKKKLLSLLMLELSFLSIIFMFFFTVWGSSGEMSFFCLMLFLGFMVMDSVLGLCCLIVGSRNSSPFQDPLFNF